MSYQNETWVMGATRIVLGPLGASLFPLKIQPPVGAANGYMKLVSGGTLEIMPQGATGLNIAGATAGGLGYAIGASEIYGFQGPAAFYLGVTGATVTAVINWHYTSGATLA